MTIQPLIGFKEIQDPFEKARLLSDVHHTQHYSIKALSEELALSAPYICNLMRIVKLPDIIKDGYYGEFVSLTHLYIIARLKNHKDMIEVYEKVLAENLTTQQTEIIVRDYLYSVDSSGTRIDNETKYRIEQHFASKGFGVKIVQTRVKSKVIIEAKGNLTQTTEALKRLIEKE